MITRGFWKWLRNNDLLLKAIRAGECSEEQLEVFCQCLEDWIVEAQNYGYPYVEVEFPDLPRWIATEFVLFLETEDVQGFLFQDNEDNTLHLLISGWYSEHKLPKFDGRIYQFKTEIALKRKLPDFAKQQENEQVYYDTANSFKEFTYKNYFSA